ncbi:MAG: MATE family efflux transporter [Synergistaceae bacterium]|nr:MATE family efflux transporter [Synergistaceae bacterium]
MAYTSDNNEKISVVARELEKNGVLKTYTSYIPSFVISKLVEFLATAIDHWILTYLLGSTALSVASRVLPFYYWILFAYSLFDGFHIYISHSFGENDQHKVNTLFTFSFYLMLIVTIISTFLYCHFPVVIYLLEEPNVSADYLVKLGHQYLSGIAWGVFPMIALSALSYMVRIDGSRYLPIYANSAVVICNIILDFLLIGKFRYYGAGVATSISYWIGFFILITHFLKETNTYRLLAKINFSEISFKKLMSFTCPKVANLIAKLCNIASLTFLGFRNSGVIFGAVSSIYLMAHEFIYIVILGIVEASRPLLGVTYGQKNYKTLHKILYAMYKLTIPSTAVLCLILFVFPQAFPLLMNLHTYDEAFAPACTAIRLLTIYAMSYAFTYLYRIYYQQIGYAKFISIINLLESTVFIIPFYYLFAYRANANGFWWANIYKGLITLIVLLSFHLWQSYKLRPKYREA